MLVPIPKCQIILKELHILKAEVAVRRCSSKKVLLKILQYLLC